MSLRSREPTTKLSGECSGLKEGRSRAIEGSSQKLNRRLRLGMVGGGPGAFIGAVHRIAARLDDRYELVAAALSSDADRSLAAAKELHSPRAYRNYEEMASAESKRDDAIEAVSIVT